MTSAMISFLDGEILYADVEDVSFSVPVIEARVRNVGSNSDRALLPLSAIREIMVGEVAPAPDPAVLDTWERAVFRFLDGQVLRAHIEPGPLLGRHGGLWRCVEAGTTEERCLGIPYAALKAVFEVHAWDSRTTAQRAGDDATEVADAERLARILTERSGESEPVAAGQALLARVRRTGGGR